MNQSFNQELKAEIEEFRAFGHRFLKKEVTAAEFKAKSGGMGVYAQRGGELFMIRLRMPSGVVSREHLELIHHYAQTYGLEKVHLTTRQTFQLHHLPIDAVCDIMEDALDHGLYTRGGGGNYPRNVALSPLSGVEPGEAFDVTPFALLAGEYFLSQITSYRLPRKLKVAFSNSRRDTANARATDLGFLAVRENGVPRFEVWLAGGLGNGYAAGIPLGETIDPREALYHIEAVTRLFIAEGDYENRARARLRYLPAKMGAEGFLSRYREHLAAVKAECRFPELAAGAQENEIEQAPESDDLCLLPQKQKGKYTVLIHPRGGQLGTGELNAVLEFLRPLEEAEVRLTMEESMAVRNLSEQKARELLALTKGFRAGTRVEQSVSCIGVPTCQIGIEKSEALLSAILGELARNAEGARLLPQIHISGCQNSCARHQLASIGFSGKRKRMGEEVVDAYELFLGGGAGSEDFRLARPAGTIPAAEIPKMIGEIAGVLQKKGVAFGDCLAAQEGELEALISRYRI